MKIKNIILFMIFSLSISAILLLLGGGLVSGGVSLLIIGAPTYFLFENMHWLAEMNVGNYLLYFAIQTTYHLAIFLFFKIISYIFRNFKIL